MGALAGLAGTFGAYLTALAVNPRDAFNNVMPIACIMAHLAPFIAISYQSRRTHRPRLEHPWLAVALVIIGMAVYWALFVWLYVLPNIATW